MSVRPWHTTALALGITVATTLATPMATAQSGSDTADRTTIAGSTPAWATAQTKVGEVEKNSVRHIQIALSLKDFAAAQHLALALATPGDPQHGKFLTSD